MKRFASISTYFYATLCLLACCIVSRKAVQKSATCLYVSDYIFCTNFCQNHVIKSFQKEVLLIFKGYDIIPLSGTYACITCMQTP